MFSTALSHGSQNASPATTTMRGRRRQRPLSSDNSLQPKPKRLRQERPVVTDQTFIDPINNIETYEVRSARPSMVELRQDGIEQSLVHVPKHELSVRSKKARPGDRHTKGDGSTLLSTNAAYDVRKLPALPDRLKLDTTSRQHGGADSSTGYAVTFTHTHAVVWPYATPSQSPESFTFTLPYPSKHSTDPLPLGALVSPSASSSEPGLLVVMPNSGKVTYWESISSATTLDFMRQQRSGVEDSIPGIFSGEHVIQLINAESASGFILSFSSGRMAYLSVRDAHGRPKVSVQFLRTSLGPTSGGLFGSIRHALSPSALQGDIAAVRSERVSEQGECIVAAMTSKGRLHTWRIHRGGHHDLLTDVDTRSPILKSVQEADQKISHMPAETLKVVDFCFVPKGLDAKYAEMSQLRQMPLDDTQQHLLVLVSLSSKRVARYSLVEIVVPRGASAENPVDIGIVRPLSSYTTCLDPHAPVKPRVYLPKPSIICFIVLDHATVIASVARGPESPEAQFMEDNHMLPASFEDVVDLREDPTLEIVGSGIEEPYSAGAGTEETRFSRVKAKNPAVILLVRGAGTLRISVTDVERFASEKPPELTAKSKLEQAVFFGVKEDNPLTFDGQHNLLFANQDYGLAALELSQEILTCSGPRLSTIGSRVDATLKDRIRYLQKIMIQMSSLKIDLDRLTKWQLLWNAEKMHVASILWRKHEGFLQSRPEDSKKSIVADIVEYIKAEEKTEPDPAKGETDQLRHWFVHDIDRMQLLIAWAYEVIKHNSKANLEKESLTRLIYEAAEVYNGSIQGALNFRKENLELYGLGNEELDNGILVAGYGGLPIPWTCTPYIVNNVKRQFELATEWVKQHLTKNEAKDEFVRKTQELLPELTEDYLTVLQELARSKIASGDPKTVSDGQKFETIYKQDRHDKVILLVQTANWESAVRIAESHRSLPALAEILTREIDDLRDQMGATGLSAEQIEGLDSRMAAREDHVKECFGRYGKDFAFPFYEYLFTTFGVDALLEYDGDKRFKTMYLRTKPELAKISWINDIIGEEDIDHAADTLLDLGLAREQQIWNKKIELSLGKLARMAESSRPSSQASMSVQEANVAEMTGDARVDAIDKELTIIGIQNEFYETQIRPVTSVALDESEELGLAQEAFALKHPKKYKILTQILEDALGRLLKHEALDALTLIDILTLVTLPPETVENIADQFFLAIQVAYSGLNGAERVQVERLIWRRCFLREDWTRINNTSLKNDSDVMDMLGETDLFQFYCTLYANQRGGEDDSKYKRLSPSEVAGVYTETLDRRFGKMEKSYREKVLEAMRWEDSNLVKHIDKHRLDQWAKETRKLAETAVDQEFDETTAAKMTKSPPNKLVSKRKQLNKASSNEATNGQNGTH